MTKERISSQVKMNIREAGWSIADDGLRVQPDPYAGWWLVVVSPDFEGKSLTEKKEIVLAGLEDIKFEWVELLTPEERKMSGALPIDTDGRDLPFWPEALAKGNNRGPGESVRFLSDCEKDIDAPITTTFYSLRGGVGRSTALAYTAQILAKNNKKVICVDMDLEAPGITSLFGKEIEVRESMGLVHVLMEIDQGETPDLSKHLIRISESHDLYCLPAGKPDADYARKLRYIDPESWYREDRNPLHELMDLLKTGLPFTPDVILLDSRTGITQLSGPLMFDLSDMSIIVFFPHPQARTGTEALVKALLAAKTKRVIEEESFTPEIRFLVSPIPSTNINEVKRYKNRANEWIARWIESVSTEKDILADDITHYVSYNDMVATSDFVIEEENVWHNYGPLADWIEGLLPAIPGQDVAPQSPSSKLEILNRFHFSAGTAEKQDDLLATFLETALVKKAMSPDIPLVLGRKGTGKTAVFRRLSEADGQDSIIITCPPDLSRRHPFFLSIDGFKSIKEVINNSKADWREFWTIYTALICYYSLYDSHTDLPLPQGNNHLISPQNRPANELDIINFIEGFIDVSRYGLIASDWLSKMDRFMDKKVLLLLFDGLDTGFGKTPDDRKRRAAALEGLFTFLTDSGGRLNHFKFKIMLREDIWKFLKFENKSHLFGRSASLKWSDQISFLKVALKQAIKNKDFKELTGKNSGDSIENWSETQVMSAWNKLAGERMSGGKTAFTRNWVWKRLADGNNDHSPRYLLQLLHQAVEWEKKEQKRNPYPRSIIRPRALSSVLPEVSEQALSALRDEEFPELKELMDSLENKHTTIDAEKLDADEDLISLAKEVGFLAIYEENGEEVKRFRVPELYRHALNLKRQGQV